MDLHLSKPSLFDHLPFSSHHVKSNSWTSILPSSLFPLNTLCLQRQISYHVASKAQRRLDFGISISQFSYSIYFLELWLIFVLDPFSHFGDSLTFAVVQNILWERAEQFHQLQTKFQVNLFRNPSKTLSAFQLHFQTSSDSWGQIPDDQSLVFPLLSFPKG